METVHISSEIVEDFSDAVVDPGNPGFAALRRVLASSNLDELWVFYQGLQGQVEAAMLQMEMVQSQIPPALRTVMQPRMDAVRGVVDQMRQVLLAIGRHLEDPQGESVDGIWWQLDRMGQEAMGVFEMLTAATRSRAA
ncbi:MAG: hypothetical protein ACYCW6_24040 [Candidatus Xenobia bacterium]